MPYTPNPDDTTNPTDAVSAETATSEFRILKTKINAMLGLYSAGAYTVSLALTNAAILLLAPLASPTFTGTVTLPDGSTVTSTGASFAKTVAITGHLVVEGVTSTGATGSGKFVFATSPTLATPALGVATSTSLAIGGATLGSNALAVTGSQILSAGLNIGSTTQQTGGLMVASVLGTSAVNNSISFDNNGSGLARVFSTGTSSTFGIFTLYMAKTGGAVTGILGSDTSGNLTALAGSFSVSSGLANSVVLAGSAGNPSVTPSSGSLVLNYSTTTTNLTISNSNFLFNAPSNPGISMIDASLGTDLKRWLLQLSGGNVILQATNDAFSTGTTAYLVSRGTTTNVQAHTWYTSVTAGTPVASMGLTGSLWSLPSTVTAQFGTYTGTPTTCTGTILINDAAGNSRKVMVGA